MKFWETGITLATGTGFIYEFENYYYMITNGHNVTGINPETDQRIANHCGFPDLIETKVRQQYETEGLINPEVVILSEIDFPLYADEYKTKPLWYIHPEHGYKVDVVAIPLEEVKNVASYIKLFPINKFDWHDYAVEVADDVFILGYPLNIIDSWELPIWKRGSIATEPDANIENLPKLLVDTASRPGMSGSPVFFRRDGLHKFNSLIDTNFRKSIIGTIEGFVGVYSGRMITKDDRDAQLGIVWKAQVIEEILKAKKTGTIEFQSK